jgi:hypothetical protein
VRPPQYGAPGKAPQHERKRLIAKNMLDEGVISQADYDRMISGL